MKNTTEERPHTARRRLGRTLQQLLGLDKPQESPEAFRNRRLRYTAATSIVSKVVTFALQVLAMPVAIRTLGTEQFAVYAMINSAVAWLNLANFGIGPGLTVGIASATAQDDERREQELFTSAFLTVLILVFAVGILLFSVLGSLPTEALLSSDYRIYYPAARASLYLVVLFILAYALSTVIESTQAGYQEGYIYNAWLIGGNILIIVALLLMPVLKPTLVTMVLVVSGPPLLARLANASLFLIQHRSLRLRLQYYRFSQTRVLLSSGIAFSLTAIGSFLNNQLPIVLIGQQSSAESTATLAAAMTFYILSFGMVNTLTLPLWPALADSKIRNDGRWAKQAYKTILVYGMGYATLVAAIMSLGGVWILRIWFGPSVNPDSTLMLGLGVYMLTSSWEYLHQMVLVGLDKIRISSFLFGLRSLFVPLFLPVVIASGGSVAALAVLSVAVITVTAWSFPLLTRATLRGIGRPDADHVGA